MSAGHRIRTTVMDIEDCALASIVERLPEYPTGWVLVKTLTDDGHIIREFDHPDYPHGGVLVISYEEDEIVEDDEDDDLIDPSDISFWIIPKGTLLVAINEDDEGGMSIMLSTEGFHELSGGYMFDQHSEFLWKYLGFPAAHLTDECTENTFVLETQPADLKADLVKLGVKVISKFSDLAPNSIFADLPTV